MNITWSYRGDQLFSSSEKYGITKLSSHSSSLNITDIEEDDFGVYGCLVTDILHLPITQYGYVNHTSEYVCLSVCLSVLCMCVCVCVCVCMCVCVCVCVCVYC